MVGLCVLCGDCFRLARMMRLIALMFLVASSAFAQMPSPAQLDDRTAERFANLALACVHKEYPNKIAHVLNSDADVKPPRELTPAFYGCYDWHSSVHGHWLLVRLARAFPDAPFTSKAWAALQQSLAAENIRREAAYVKRDGNAPFERPYGLAWLMTLGAELREIGGESGANASAAKQLAANLEPLEQAARARLMDWLPKLANPIRIGEHNQTAFSLGLLIDSARMNRDQPFVDLLTRRARDFYFNDKLCPLSYEPSGEDFLSPCLAEADVMRRVLSRDEFPHWLTTFLPQIPRDGSAAWLKPAVVVDPTDPKLAHLDGLNLSRAWMLEGIASALPPSDPRLSALRATAKAHSDAGLAHVTGEHYEGGHWLGSFAVYLTTQRGISK
jgi:Protein of unknown function (DUF2891)